MLALGSMYEKVKQHTNLVVCSTFIKIIIIDVATYLSLGNIPLRHLVYGVLDLPPSMRPLVYDFGQLKTDTEYQYIYQVVSNHVRNCPLNYRTSLGHFSVNFYIRMQVNRHRGLRSIGHHAVAAIAKVLNCSQDYMKRTKVYKHLISKMSYTPMFFFHS